MVSCYGSDLMPYDWTYELSQNNTPNKPFAYQKGSLMNEISTNPHYSYFFDLVKIGAVASLLNSFTIDYTIFVPSNAAIQDTFKPFNENIILNMDKYTAKEIVLYHILPMHMPLNALESSNGMYLETKIDNEIHANILYQKVFAHKKDTGEELNILTLNNIAYIERKNSDKKFNNGLLHEISSLLIPPAFRHTFAPYIVCSQKKKFKNFFFKNSYIFGLIEQIHPSIAI